MIISLQCDILLSAMTNLPPVIVIEFGDEELANARIANMLQVLVDVLQHRLRSAYRTIVLLSIPPPSLFAFIANTNAHDVRIVGSPFFQQDCMAQSVWNFVSTGDGARLCADALRKSQELGHCLAERKLLDMHNPFFLAALQSM